MRAAGGTSPASRARAAARRAFGALGLAVTLAGLTAGGSPAPAQPPGTQQPGTRHPETQLRRMHFAVRLVDVPVDEADNPRAFQYIIDFLPTGSVIRRRITITNQEERTASFTVYPAAAQISGGQFTGAAGHARNELTGWVTVQHPSLTLRPGQSAADLVTIRVPPGATRDEHYGVIWAEQAESVPVRQRVTIRDVARVGIRVYLAVGRGGVPPTSFAITSVSGQRLAAGPQVIAHARNAGERAIDLAGTVRLAGGPGGSSAGPFAARETLTLAPGQAGNVTFALPADLPAGSWAATVTLASGVTTATARATVSLGGQAAAASWASPVKLAWGGGMLLGLSVIAAVVIARGRRLRRALA
jgi:hypothetical protein